MREKQNNKKEIKSLSKEYEQMPACCCSFAKRSSFIGYSQMKLDKTYLIY